jgi:universal stress protein E
MTNNGASYQRILLIVPAGSGPSPALAQGIALARRTQAQLVLQACADSGDTDSEAASWLASTLTLLKSEGIEASGHLSAGPANPESLLADIGRFAPDLVIKQPGKNSALRRLFSTPEDQALARQCPIPLLVVGSQGDRLPHRVLAAVDTVEAEGTDDLNAMVISQAERLAAATGAEVHIAHAVEPVINMPEDAGLQGVAATPVLTEELQALHRERFNGIAARYRIPEQHRHLVFGNVDIALEELSEQIGAEVIVAGHHPRGAFERFLVGSTSEHLLSHGKQSVLIVKQPH